MLPKEQIEMFRQMCWTATGRFDKRRFEWLCEDASRTKEFVGEDFPPERTEKVFYPRMDIKQQQKKAMTYIIENFSREERFLIMFRRDCEKYVSCFTSENFSDNGKREMVIGEFHQTFHSLRDKMNEFHWTKDFLKENGIDFKTLRKLFFRVANY